jgi:hypothetical protein
LEKFYQHAAKGFCAAQGATAAMADKAAQNLKFKKMLR